MGTHTGMPDDADGINRRSNSGEIGHIDVTEWQIRGGVEL